MYHLPRGQSYPVTANTGWRPRDGPFDTPPIRGALMPP